MKGVEQPPEFHPEGDVWTHTLMMLGEHARALAPRWPWACCCTTSASRPRSAWRTASASTGTPRWGRAMAVDILTRLRFSNDEIGRVEALVANHLRFKDVTKMRESTLKRFLRQEHFDEHLELHRLDCLVSHGRLDNYEFLKRKLAEAPREELKPRRSSTATT